MAPALSTWVEPVKHWACDGCYKRASQNQRGCDKWKECIGDYDMAHNGHERRNYTPKEPEPVVKENFTAVEPVKRTCRNCGMPANDCSRDWLSRKASKSVPIWCKNWTPKEPEPVKGEL